MSCKCHKKHDHKVHETRARSVAKAVSFRIIEIIMDMLLIIACMRSGLPELLVAGISAVSVEASCGVGYYFWERLWNKISWGRIVEDVKQ